MVIMQATGAIAARTLHANEATATSAGFVQPLTLRAAAQLAARLCGAGVSDQHTADAMHALRCMVAGTWTNKGATLCAIAPPPGLNGETSITAWRYDRAASAAARARLAIR